MNFNPSSKLYMGILASVIGVMFIVGVAAVDAQNSPSTQKGLELPSEVKELPSKEKRWALIIGINKYEASRSLSELEGAENDAKYLRDALRDHADFPENQIVLMTTDPKTEDLLKPRRQNILRELARITRNIGEDGLLLFAFSGHGISTPDGQAFLLPSDADMFPDIDYLTDGALPVRTIQNRIISSHVKQVIILLDACRNVPRQGARGNEATAMTDGFRFNQLNKDVKVAVTLYATEIGKVAWENKATRRGYFMEAVVAGLSGAAADPRTGNITLGSLIDYVGNTVRSNTAREDSQQIPFFDQSGNSLRLVIAKTRVSLKVPFSIRTYPPPTAKVAIRSQGKIISEGTTVNGEFSVQLDQGNYDIEVWADKYKSQKHQVAVNFGGRPEERFDLTPTTGSISIYLYAISPSDKDLRVFLDDSPRTFTKAVNPIVLNDINEGPHRLRVEHPNIVNSGIEAAINLKGGEGLSYPVVAKPSASAPAPGSSMGAFSLRANVSSARVAIRSNNNSSRDGEVRNGEYHIDLPPGTYDVEVLADKYKPKPWKKQITIEQGRSLSEAVVLTSEVGSIVVDLGSIGSGDKELQILIDGRRANFTKRADNRVELTDINEGPHQLRVEHPSAILVNEKLDLQGGGVMNYHIYPKPAVAPPLAPTTGILSIAVKPTTARVIVKSKTTSLSEERLASSQPRFELPPGDYDVKVIADRYRTWTQPVTITRGDLRAIPVTLEPDVVGVTIKGPAGASIYLDSSSKGAITSTGELVLADIVPGSHTIEATLSGFKDFRVERSFTADELLPIKMERTVYSAEITDEFKDLVNWEAPANWKVMPDGKPGVRVSGPDTGLLRNSVFKYFELQMVVSLNNNKGAVWMLRARDKSNYFLFRLTPKEFTTYVCRNGQPTRIGSPGSLPKNLLPGSGEPFTLRVVANASQIKTWIKGSDGVERTIGVLQNPDEVFYDGNIGFGTFDGEDFTIRLLTIVPTVK